MAKLYQKEGADMRKEAQEAMDVKRAASQIKALRKKKGETVFVLIRKQAGSLFPVLEEGVVEAIENAGLCLSGRQFIDFIGYGQFIEMILDGESNILYRRPQFRPPNNTNEFLDQAKILFGRRAAKVIAARFARGK